MSLSPIRLGTFFFDWQPKVNLQITQFLSVTELEVALPVFTIFTAYYRTELQ